MLNPTNPGGPACRCAESDGDDECKHSRAPVRKNVPAAGANPVFGHIISAVCDVALQPCKTVPVKNYPSSKFANVQNGNDDGDAARAGGARIGAERRSVDAVWFVPLLLLMMIVSELLFA